MEILQVTLIITLVLLCIALTAVSIYSIFVLKDLKDTLEDVKEISKTARKLSSYIVAPMTTVAGVMGGISKGIQAVRSITDMFSKDNEDDEEAEL